MEDKNIKIKGDTFPKVVWILGAVFFGYLLNSCFLSIGNPVEDPADCIEDALQYLVYFAAYVLGLIYLFCPKLKSFSWYSAIVYAAAVLFGLILNLSGESVLSADTLAKLIMTTVVYALFAVFLGIVVGGKDAGLQRKCLRFWYLPSVLLLVVGLIANLWAEFARPDGFLLDGFVLDTAVDIVSALPLFMLSLVVKKRTIQD